MKRSILIIALLLSVNSIISQTISKVELSDQVISIIRHYSQYIDSARNYDNTIPYSLIIQFKEEKSLDIFLISPVFYLSELGSINPLTYSIVDSSLVVIYNGFDRHIKNDSLLNERLTTLYSNYVIDDRIQCDEEGFYIIPFIDAHYKRGYYEMKENDIITMQLKYCDTFYNYAQ